jgi:hypothetical protein
VESPGGSKDLQVVFTLPPELEFVEGNGGVAFEGQGQNAHTVRFDVPAGGRQTLSLFAKAVSAPESSQVEITASVLNASGDPVASATERTQVKP